MVILTYEVKDKKTGKKFRNGEKRKNEEKTRNIDRKQENVSKKKLQIREKERIMIGKAEGEKIMAAMNFIFSPCL